MTPLAQFSGKPFAVAHAPETLQWLVKFAEASATVTYLDLGKLVGVHHHAALPSVLFAVGNALKKLPSNIPPIQLLAVNSETQIPGDSGLGWIIKDKKELKGLSLQGKRHRWEPVRDRIFQQHWSVVLRQFGLTPLVPEEEEEIEWAVARFGYEGRIKVQIHRCRERDSKLTNAKKAEAENKYGELGCEVCGFVFTERYGEHGAGFIECHHREPLRQITGDGKKVTLEDLALVCANCHRMLHRNGWPSIDELRLRLLPK
jgi:hypothetical protein